MTCSPLSACALGCPHLRVFAMRLNQKTVIATFHVDARQIPLSAILISLCDRNLCCNHEPRALEIERVLRWLDENSRELRAKMICCARRMLTARANPPPESPVEGRLQFLGRRQSHSPLLGPQNPGQLAFCTATCTRPVSRGSSSSTPSCLPQSQ